MILLPGVDSKMFCWMLVLGRCRRVPEVRFLGADSVIVPLKDSLNANLATWDRKKMPRINLEAVLGIEFPPPKVCTALTTPFKFSCFSYFR
jgi:hypothetical protein